MVEDQWGELCRSREVPSYWADQLLGLLRTAWSDPQPGNYVRGTSVCLSSLLAAGRHQELLELLALQRFPYWHDRKFGIQSLLSRGRIDEALAYAEASRGLNQPDTAIEAACEKILLDTGRTDKAYQKYALTAKGSSTGPRHVPVDHQEISRLRPEKDPFGIGHIERRPWPVICSSERRRLPLHLALEFANTGRTDPHTLSRASRDLLKKDARFCLEVGRLAIQRILEGHG